MRSLKIESHRRFGAHFRPPQPTQGPGLHEPAGGGGARVPEQGSAKAKAQFGPYRTVNMQQWEDWGNGLYWRILIEKTLLTLLVASATYYAWTWVQARAEAAQDVTVQIPTQLTKDWKKREESEVQAGESCEEVSFYAMPSRLATLLTAFLGQKWQDLSAMSSRWPPPSGRTDKSSHTERH